MMNKMLTVFLTALPIAVVAALLVAAGLGGPAGGVYANLPASIPGQIERVLIDADTTQDGVQTCRSVNVGDSVSVDIILDEIDPADGTLDGGGGGTVGLRYTDAPLDLASVIGHPDGPWSSASIQPGLEEEVGDGTKHVVAYTAIIFPDASGDRPEFSGVQPIFRVTFDAVASGLATINLGNVAGPDDTRDFSAALGALGESVKIFDPFEDDGDGAAILERQGAFIAVGEACPTGAPEPFADEPTTATLSSGEPFDPGTFSQTPGPGTPDTDTPGPGTTGDQPENGLPAGGGEPDSGEIAGSEPDSAGEPTDDSQEGMTIDSSESEDGGTSWTLVAVIAGGIAALAAAGAAWWRLRRRSAVDGGGE